VPPTASPNTDAKVLLFTSFRSPARPNFRRPTTQSRSQRSDPNTNRLSRCAPNLEWMPTCLGERATACTTHLRDVTAVFTRSHEPVAQTPSCREMGMM